MIDPTQQASLSGTVSGASLKTRFLDALGSWPDPPEAIGEALARLLDILWGEGLFVLEREPRTELVMTTIRDPFNTPFYLGEVLVTAAEVSWGDPAACSRMGFGMIQGDKPEEAILLAALDAMGTAVPRELMGSIEAFLAQLEAGAEDHRRQTSKMAAATAVQFESMKKERVDFGSLGGGDR